MILTTAPGSARLAARLRLVSLVAAALLLAHTAIYAAEDGLGGAFATAMTSNGHGDWWLPLILVVFGAGATTIGLVLWRLARLEGRAHGMTWRRRRRGDPSYLVEVGGISRRLVPLVLGLFLVQENLESLAAHGRLLGIDAIVGSHPLAIPVVALVGLALAFVGALVRWRTAVLRRRLANGTAPERRRLGRSGLAGRWHVIGALAPRAWMLDRLDAGRSPPALLPR
jgi:hypothetical protein